MNRYRFLALVYLHFLPDRIALFMTAQRRTYIVTATRNGGAMRRFEAEWPELWADLRHWAATGRRDA